MVKEAGHPRRAEWRWYAYVLTKYEKSTQSSSEKDVNERELAERWGKAAGQGSRSLSAFQVFHLLLSLSSFSL